MKRLLNISVVLALGILTFTSCEKEVETGSEASSNPKVDMIDPGRAPGNEVLTVTGTGIGGVTSIFLKTVLLHLLILILIRIMPLSSGSLLRLFLENRI